MRQITIIAVILALVATFVVPLGVGADDRCDYTTPGCAPLPDKATQTLAGAALWSLMGAMDPMGMAVAQTTGTLVCRLGGWSDEMGVWGVDAMAVIFAGVAGLLPALGDMIGVPDLISPVADMLEGLAGLFRA